MHPTQPEISAEILDWSREKPGHPWDPSRRLLASIRAYQALPVHGSFFSRLRRKWLVLVHRFWTTITQAEIQLNSDIGGGLLLPHPNGVVINPAAKIGPNCLIFQQVTIGTGGAIQGCPIIGGHVDIGAGAKVLGGITIGDHALIGANAVVVRDVPAGWVAVGIPAESRPRRCTDRST